MQRQLRLVLVAGCLLAAASLSAQDAPSTPPATVAQNPAPASGTAVPGAAVSQAQSPAGGTRPAPAAAGPPPRQGAAPAGVASDAADTSDDSDDVDDFVPSVEVPPDQEVTFPVDI